MRLNHCLAGLTLGFIVSASEAVPMYYTFKGEATESNYAGIGVGQQVTYTFMVDLDASAYYIEHSLRAEWPDNSQFDYFLVDFVAGDAIPEERVTTFWAENHIGVNHADESRLIGANTDGYGSDAIVISGSGVFSTWSIGKNVGGFNFSDIFGLEVHSSLTLTSISDAPPAAVPEPGSLALFGAGLLGLGAVATRRRR